MEGKPLKVALEAVGMARSSYYYRPVRKRKSRALDDALVRAINEGPPGPCRGLRLQKGYNGPQGCQVDD
ncbi:hypothetical protein ACFLYR_09785 [Chloroflexota bacterium]